MNIKNILYVLVITLTLISYGCRFKSEQTKCIYTPIPAPAGSPSQPSNTTQDKVMAMPDHWKKPGN